MTGGVLGWLDTSLSTRTLYEVRVCVFSSQGGRTCCCGQFTLFKRAGLDRRRHEHPGARVHGHADSARSTRTRRSTTRRPAGRSSPSAATSRSPVTHGSATATTARSSAWTSALPSGGTWARATCHSHRRCRCTRPRSSKRRSATTTCDESSRSARGGTSSRRFHDPPSRASWTQDHPVPGHLGARGGPVAEPRRAAARRHGRPGCPDPQHRCRSGKYTLLLDVSDTTRRALLRHAAGVVRQQADGHRGPRRVRGHRGSAACTDLTSANKMIPAGAPCGIAWPMPPARHRVRRVHRRDGPRRTRATTSTTTPADHASGRSHDVDSDHALARPPIPGPIR